MRVVVVTKSRARRGSPGVELHHPTRLPLLLDELGPDDLLYLDLAGIPGARGRALLRRLLGSSRPRVGVVDPEGTITDVPALFHAGAVDYLDRPAWRKGLLPKRLQAVRAYVRTLRRSDVPAEEPRADTEAIAAPGRASGRDWSALKAGEEYTFSLLFFEIDEAEELERRYAAAPLAEALASFRSYVERSVAPFGGRLWIWSRFGGIALFLFDGRNEQASACALRTALFKHLYDIEDSPFPHYLSFRMAAHLGELLWRERQTGTVVADVLNATFHLGQHFTPPGRCCITEEVYRLATPALKGFLVAAGEFEGRRIWMMRRLREPGP